MPESCQQCGASTTWDDSVGSAVCTSCGSLVDPSQSVLTSAQYAYQSTTAETSLWDSSAATTLKSLRAGNNWDLAGQGKESRDRKNAYAMAEFIKSLAVSFNASGLSPRAITLFNQARSAAHFRWGAKSRSVAAACLAIALRESNRPDSLRDIASVLKVPPSSVTREFTSITSTLGLSLTLVDPSVHIPTLQAHLASELREHQQKSALQASLVQSLRALCLRSVANTAISLCHLLARLSPDHDVLRLPVPPTACAIFILALESENRAVLNPLGDLAQFLGARCHSAKSVVMTRYKTIQDEIASWVEKVPWLDKYESKKGRAKVSKRLIVARGIKDVIQFQEEIWQKQAKPALDLDASDEEENEEELLRTLDVSRPRKRPKLNSALTQATRFLLDPLGTSTPRLTSSSSTTTLPAAHLPLATYILTNPSTSTMPTRLQLLALDRGGADPAQIPDEDLFAEGEFEKLLRSEDEIRVVREAFGWVEGEDGDDDGENSNVDETVRKTRKKQSRGKKRTNADLEEVTGEEGIADGAALRLRKKSRLNFEALAQFLAEDHDDVDDSKNEGEIVDISMHVMGLEEVVDYSDDEDEDGIHLTLDATLSPRHRRQGQSIPQTRAINASTDADADGEVILDNWRPPTPEYGTAFTDSRYEEEYA